MGCHARDSKSEALGVSPWPPALLRTRLIRSTALIWVACRATGFAVTVTAAPPAGPPLMIALVAFLVRFDIRRSRELTLFQNLAVHPALVVLIVVLVAAVLETLLWLGLSALGLWDGVGASA